MNGSRNGFARRASAAAFASAAAMALVPDAAVPGAAQAPGDGAYTAAQAESGRAIYERECAVCHQSNLQGTFEAPQLAGESFLRFWADLSPGDLFVRISGSMPPGQAGSLTDEAYLDVVAYLLEANGAPAGGAALTEAAAVPIGTLAAATAASVAPAAGGAAAGAPAAAAPPRLPRYPRPRRYPRPPRQPRRRRLQPPRPSRGASPWPARSRTTGRSPTPCCAIRTTATG